jgi:two-component system sensor histidine kinase HydH
MKRRIKTHRGIISSWIVIGMSLILVIAVGILAVVNYNREKEGMQQLLSEKGAALIKSFEAGTRTGMMGRFGSGSRLQTLLTETASQEDILYIALVDVNGTILAHSDPDGIGRRFISPAVMQALAASEKTGWRLIDMGGEPSSFEVYKKFLPVLASPGHPQRHRMMRGNRDGRNGEEIICQPGWMEGLPRDRILDTRQRPVIFVGMAVDPYIEAMREDFRQTLIISAIILLLGLAGVVSLFWAQSYTRSRKLLRDTRAFASEMVANLPEGIVVTGKDGRITFINSIAREMLDLQHQNTHGIDPEEILPEKITGLTEEISAGKKTADRELTLTNASGNELSVTVTVTEILSEDGDFVGIMYILHDLTQIKGLQEAIRRQEKMAAIGNLAAGVAHEVRNPLSSIKGYATYFGSLFEEGSERKKAADVMTAEVERLNRVISELLEIARPSDIKPRKTDLSGLLVSSLRLIRQEAENDGITIRTVVPDDFAPLNIDPDRVTQALINLYINAIQAMPGGGTLTISAAETEGGVAITVADTGTGIGQEKLSKIFDPYYTTKNTGTGLGLAVVQKVVDAHGGTVEVKSSAGAGTTFVITLPRGAGGEEK